MRVLLLSDGKNPHTIKWVKSLAGQGADILVFSFANFDSGLYSEYSNVECYSAQLDIGGNKLNYLFTLKALKAKITEFKPTVLHAHYASSYGLLGALSGFSPYLVSVWGTDVFEFPKRSLLHKAILKFNLARATQIFSTSRVMADETRQYTSKPIDVIPFGVDLEKFAPRACGESEDEIVVGTIKTLEPKYGIDVLIRAFAEVKRRNISRKLKLLIVGRGYLEKELKTLTAELGVINETTFTGWISVDAIPDYHNQIDITVVPSVCKESFGVSAVEASACEKPVIVSDVGGLPEVIVHNETGLVVPPGDVVALADAIEQLVNDQGLRHQLGIQGRKRVAELFNWKNNFSTMMEKYKQVEIVRAK